MLTDLFITTVKKILELHTSLAAIKSVTKKLFMTVY